MDANKTFIFMVAIAALLVMFLIFNPIKTPQVQQQTSTTQTTTAEIDENKKPEIKIIDNNTGFEFVEEKQEQNYDMVYDNGKIKVVFDPANAVIRNAYVNNTDLVQGSDKYGSLELKLGSWDNDITVKKLTNGQAYYNYKREKNKFIFTVKFKNIEDGNIFTIKKTFTFFDDENVFKLDINISNDKNRVTLFDNSGQAFSIGLGPLTDMNPQDKNNSRYYMYAYLKDKKIKKVTINDKLVKKNNNFYTVAQEGSDSWIANDQHFFASMMLPDSNRYKYFFDYRDIKDSNFYCGLSRDTREISNIKSEFYIYIGPKYDRWLNMTLPFLSLNGQPAKTDLCLPDTIMLKKTRQV